jgi:uncharacterized membrane protein YfcA
MLIEILGYFGAVLIGVILGLLGGGGSILTLPILVYLFNIEPVLATSYSLFIVGTGAFIGSISYMKKDLLDYKTAVIFAIPSFIAIYFSRHYLLPLLPKTLFSLDSNILSESFLFAITLLVGMGIATATMFKSRKNNDSDFTSTLALMLPAGIMVFLVRQFIIPLIPSSLFSFGSIEINKGSGLMIFFAIIMLWSAFKMLKPSKTQKVELDNKLSPIIIKGLTIGLLTGLVGAGGGFLIIPTLVLLVGMEIKKAIGTSLLIITVSSFFGFIADLGTQEINWIFLGFFSALTLVGIIIGSYLSSKIDGNHLKKHFADFIIIMGIITLIKEFTN